MAAGRRSEPLWLCGEREEVGTTIMRSSFQPPSAGSPQRAAGASCSTWTAEKDRARASGPFPQNSGPERLLPGTGRLHLMGCSAPNTFLPRKRRSAAAGEDMAGECRSLDVSSVTGLPYTRRKHLPGPDSHLAVPDFDGGVQGPAGLFHPTHDRH